MLICLNVISTLFMVFFFFIFITERVLFVLEIEIHLAFRMWDKECELLLKFMVYGWFLQSVYIKLDIYCIWGFCNSKTFCCFWKSFPSNLLLPATLLSLCFEYFWNRMLFLRFNFRDIHSLFLHTINSLGRWFAANESICI